MHPLQICPHRSFECMCLYEEHTLRLHSVPHLRHFLNHAVLLAHLHPTIFQFNIVIKFILLVKISAYSFEKCKQTKLHLFLHLGKQSPCKINHIHYNVYRKLYAYCLPVNDWIRICAIPCLYRSVRAGSHYHVTRVTSTLAQWQQRQAKGYSARVTFYSFLTILCNSRKTV